MIDLISRQAAIDMFQRLADNDWNRRTKTTWGHAYAEAVEMLEELPSVEPERECERCIEKLSYSAFRSFVEALTNAQSEDIRGDE